MIFLSIYATFANKNFYTLHMQLYHFCRYAIFMAMTAYCISCDLIDYHPYDVHITGETGINATNIARIEANCLDKQQIRVAVIGDSHRWYDELKLFVKAINNRDDIDFVIHDGDLCEYGYTQEFLWTRDDLGKLKVPYVALLGNHDCLGTGRDAFGAVFGDTNFSFIAGRVKFVCLNTNALEYDYSDPIPDFKFIEAQATERADQFDCTVGVMHARPGDDVFNNNVESVFHYYMTRLPNYVCSINGHGHSLRHDDLMGDGIIYHQSPCLEDRIYLLFTFNNDGIYSYEEVAF